MNAAPAVAALRAATRDDFLTFLSRAFAELHPGERLHPTWPLEAIAARLHTIDRNGGARLIVNLPPRSLKSITVSVAWVAWMLGRDPRLKFVCASYANELSEKHARDCRRLMLASWYQSVFPRSRLERLASHDLVTTLGGGRYATSVDGSLTGLGGDIIIVDDPLKPGEAPSAAARAAVKEWYSSTLQSRLNDKRTGSIIVVMQRLHEDDLSGHLIEGQGWDHLRLPAIAEEEEIIPLLNGRVHRRRSGEVLDPDREPLEVLEGLQRALGSALFAAQYQQAPVPAAGLSIRREWLTPYDEAPVKSGGDQIVQSWDCASKDGVNNDWSVCVTALVRVRKIYVIDVFRAKLQFPELRRSAIRLARDYAADTLLIEDAASGAQLIQVLRKDEPADVPRPIAQTPRGDKASRVAGATSKFENGEVLLPREAPWLSEFQRELLGFPVARHDDQVDAIVQLIQYQISRTRSDGVPVGPIIITGDNVADKRAIAEAMGIDPDEMGDDDDAFGFWGEPTRDYS